MDGLMIVHTEPVYIGGGNIPAKSPNDRLFHRIADELDIVIPDPGKKVYFLCANHLPHSRKAFLRFREYANKMTAIQTNHPYKFEKQFLIAKELAIEDKIDEIEVAGISRYKCVPAFHRFLLGQEEDRAAYRFASEDMCWEAERFHNVYTVRLNARIREDLTDRIKPL
jgi:hypothetical protein